MKLLLEGSLYRTVGSANPYDRFEEAYDIETVLGQNVPLKAPESFFRIEPIDGGVELAVTFGEQTAHATLMQGGEYLYRGSVRVVGMEIRFSLK